MLKWIKAILPYGFVRLIQKCRTPVVAQPDVQITTDIPDGETRPVVLLVDEHIPAYDRDAGGKQISTYVRLLAEMGYKVYLGSESCISRPEYEAAFAKLGVMILGASDFSSERRVDWFRRNGCKLDFVFLHRPHVAVKFWHLARIYTDAKLIFFGADLAQIRLQREYEQTKRPELLREVALAKREEDFLYTHADVNLCVGTTETKFVGRKYPSVPVYEIPLFVYDSFRSQAPDFSERQDLLFVGGFNHRPNRDAVVWFREEILPRVRAVYPDAKFHIVGSNMTPDLCAQFTADRAIVVHGFVSDDELRRLYDSCRLVVAPLRFGAGVKGKIVDALYNRCVVVTTAIGAEGILQDPMPFACADDVEGFAKAVVALYGDENSWRKLQADSQVVMQASYSRERAETLIREVFKS